MSRMKVGKCPTDELSLTNCAIVCEKDFDLSRVKHIDVYTGGIRHCVFSILTHSSVTSGTVAFNALQRKWAVLTLNQDIEVRPYQFNPKTETLSSMVLEVDFLAKKNTTTEAYDTEKMAVEFLMQFPQRAFAVGQELAFSFAEKKLLVCKVKELEAMDLENGEGKSRSVDRGVAMPNMVISFEGKINLTGKCKGKLSQTSIINPEWDFDQMGIGGLDKEFSTIFKRAFVSRVFPPEIIELLGMKHCRGILLFGPPGTGKTLMARQIGKMMNARQPKVINGPEILDKYVGESESKIRQLFAEAEEEERRMGPNSGLHIIIFDEIDAICKSRGSMASSTAVHDTVVNQLLSKIDGVDQLNNILIIGMTNRKDMIDEALLRPGRLEIQLEIGLPDENGRLQILKIHTVRMKDNDKLAPDVDLIKLAAMTKNFSGAEIEGLVRAAICTAMNRLIKADSKVVIDPEAAEKLKVTMNDFLNALDTDCKPAFGVSSEELGTYVSNGIIAWGEPVRRVLEEAELLVDQAVNDCTPLVTLLLEGAPGCGKTALAVQIALNSTFPFMKICTPQNMVGYHDAAKVQAIKKVFADAYKSQLSCVILDDIEELFDYMPTGPRFSTMVVQTLRVLLKQLPPAGHKLMVIGTTSEKDVLQEMKILSAFGAKVHVSAISSVEDLLNCLENLNAFDSKELDVIAKETSGKKLWIGIKTLLNFVGRVRRMEEGRRAAKFISILEAEGNLS